MKGRTPSGGVFSFPENKPDDARYTGNWDASKGFANCNTPYYDNIDYSGSKYSDSGLETLEAGDDAAAYNWGLGWRMPTKTDLENLAEVSGLWDSEKQGYIFGAEPCTVFLPLTGYGNGTTLTSPLNYGAYWSSSLDQGRLGSELENSVILVINNPTSPSNSLPGTTDIFDIINASNGLGISADFVKRFYGCTIRPFFSGTSEVK